MANKLITKTTSQPAGKSPKLGDVSKGTYAKAPAKRATLPAVHKPNQTITVTPVQSAVSSLGMSGIQRSFKDAADQISGSGPSKSGSASSKEALAPNASFDRSKYQSIVKKSMIGGKL